MVPEAATPEDGELMDGAGAAESEPRGLQPYSCLSCRKRRKKCDRTNPCANCRRAGTECVFVPRRPSTRQYSGPGALERVKYLEGVVQQLRAKLESLSSMSSSSSQVAGHEGVDGASSQGHATPSTQPHPTHEADGVPGLHDEDVAKLQTEFGQLAVGDGRSRYIVSNFWANLTEKVDGAASILEDLTEGDEQDGTHAGPALTSILGLGPCYADLSQLHPAPDRFAAYWRLYKENCYPIIRVLHMPTVEPIVLHYQGRPGNMPRAVEALLLAVYFSTVASLSNDECLSELGSDKCSLISRYKAGMELALARARVLETDEIMVLQAFAVFLGSVRSYCNLRLMWSLTSMAARLAQNMGIHRDGSHFGLSPFTTETRRRLWWSICVLDARAAEDSGYNTSMHASGYDARMPRNLNDADLAPDMAALPAPRVGFTEMAFGMVTFRATAVFQTLQNLSPGTIGRCGKLHTAEGLEPRSRVILQYQDMLQKLFLGHDASDPFYWYTALVSCTLLSKMWLVAYYPSLRLETCGGLPDSIRDSLFVRAVTIIESQVLLHTGLPTAKWSWFCLSHVQWYAIAFILTELGSRTHGALVDKAWRAITAVLKADRLTRPPSPPPPDPHPVTAPAPAPEHDDHYHDHYRDDPDDHVEFSAHSKFGSLQDFEYKLLNKMLRQARAARRAQPVSPADAAAAAAMPYRVPGPADLLAAAHRFDDELMAGTAELNPAAMKHCDAGACGETAVSADYVRDHLVDHGHDYPFDHLLYGSLQTDMDMPAAATAAQLPYVDMSDQGPLPPDTL